MHRKVAGTIVVLALALAGVAGCGGSKPLTRAEFVKQANLACKARAPKSATTASTSRSRGPEGFLMQVLAQQQAIVKGLDGLNAPSELDSDFEVLKKAFKDRVALVEKAVAAVKANPKAKLESLGKQAEGMQKAITSSSKALGLKDCT